MKLVDIGANLAGNQFRGDLVEVLDRATAAGVERIVVTGTNVDSSARACELAHAHGSLRCTAGVHPHHANDWGDDAREHIRASVEDDRVVALGECGLDFNRKYSTPEEQKRAFAAQLALAAECELPVFLHQRDAHVEFLAMLRDAWPSLARGAVVHCFTDGPAEAEAYLELGAHIGITGWVCDERRGDALRAAVPAIPLERMMLETDAPYLMPRTIQPKPATRRNEPANLRYVCAAVASLCSLSDEEVARRTSATAEAFFAR